MVPSVRGLVIASFGQRCGPGLLETPKRNIAPLQQQQQQQQHGKVISWSVASLGASPRNITPPSHLLIHSHFWAQGEADSSKP